MTYLLFLTFTLSTAIVPYSNKEACEKDVAYYQEQYGEELVKAECLGYEDLE